MDGPISQLGGGLSSLRLWCERHPNICGVLGFLLLVVGGRLFLAATSERAFGFALLLAVVGAAVGAFGLLLGNELIWYYVETPGNHALGRLLGFGGLIVGSGVIWFAIRSSSPLVSIIGSVLLILGLLALFVGLADIGDSNPILFTVGGLGLLFLAVLLLWITDGATIVAAVAVAVGLFGLVVFKIGLGPFIDQSADPLGQRTDVTIAAAAATAVGAALLYMAPRSFDEPLLLVGLMLPIIGLTALGVSIARFEPGRLISLVITIVGLAAVLYGGVLMSRILAPFDLVLFVVVVLAGIGAWFIFRGEALVAVLLLGFVLGWVLVDRTADEQLSPFAEGDRIIVALGDSYISGEGAPKFFPGTNLLGQDGNQCRRAPTAYPYLVAERLEADLIFLACSGAGTDALDGDGASAELLEIAGNEDQTRQV